MDYYQRPRQSNRCSVSPGIYLLATAVYVVDLVSTVEVLAFTAIELVPLPIFFVALIGFRAQARAADRGLSGANSRAPLVSAPSTFSSPAPQPTI
jgi:hypothetical protein